MLYEKKKLLGSLTSLEKYADAFGSEFNKNSSIATNALDYMNAMRTIRRQVEENSDYVGSQFAEEARKIHYGETDERNIYGEATKEEAEALKDEGIECERIPWVPDHDA